MKTIEDIVPDYCQNMSELARKTLENSIDNVIMIAKVFDDQIERDELIRNQLRLLYHMGYSQGQFDSVMKKENEQVKQ